MKNPEQLDMGVIVLEQSDEAFEKIYNKLDAYAAKIGGVAWLSDEIFDVEASKLIKYPTSSRGIFKRDHFATRIFEFTASKYPTGDQDDPFFNVFQLAETHSVPLELCKTAPEHRLGLFKHFMEYLPGLMQESLKTLVLQDGDTLEDGDTLNIENIDNDVLLDACDLVVEEMGIDVKLGRTIMYTILERGQSIQYSESNFYEIGPSKFTLVEFDSQNYNFEFAHNEQKDALKEEYFTVAPETKQFPDREMLTDAPEEQVLYQEEFLDVIEGEFGEEDHLGVPFTRHIKDIKNILKRFKKPGL